MCIFDSGGIVRTVRGLSYNWLKTFSVLKCFSCAELDARLCGAVQQNAQLNRHESYIPADAYIKNNSTALQQINQTRAKSFCFFPLHNSKTDGFVSSELFGSLEVFLYF